MSKELWRTTITSGKESERFMIEETSEPSLQKSGILTRFGYLLSAQGVEAALSAAFFLYLARVNSEFFGQISYALAGAGIVMTIVEFGMYYPLVVDLAGAKPGDSDRIISRVIALRLLLFIPAFIFVGGVTIFRGFPLNVSLVFLLICLGVALDALAETFFARLRVKARQLDEAKIKATATTLAYLFGAATIAMGFPPLVIGLYRLIGALIKIGFGIAYNFKTFSLSLLTKLKASELRIVFAGAAVFALIDILGSFYNKTNIFFLEKEAGMTWVAYYSATWNIIDGVSVMASSQFLGWIIFPLLATTFSEKRQLLAPLVRNNALWLLAVAFPIMIALYVESDFIIQLAYSSKYDEAAWMQRYLVWTIVLSFVNNLFCYLMMVVGAGRIVLTFAVLVTAFNLILNVLLVRNYGAAGACLVIIFTKLAMTSLTFGYSQIRFKIFNLLDFTFPVLLAVFAVAALWMTLPFINQHAALAATLGIYAAALFFLGKRYMGRLDGSRL